jgi:hypothetical protein
MAVKEFGVMRRLLMGLIVVLSCVLMAGFAIAQTEYTYPADAPVFSITFPEKWTVELDKEDARGVYATSPDEAIEFDIWPLDEEEVSADPDAALKKAAGDIDTMLAEYLSEFKPGDATTVDVNGIKFLEIAGPAKAKEDGSDVSVSVDFFSPDGKAIFALVYWGSPDADKANEKDIVAIVQSIKKP